MINKTRVVNRKINKVIFYCFSLPALLVLLTSCGEGAYYDDVYAFENSSWVKSDTATFQVEMDDTAHQFNFELSLRTTVEYGYSNLWMYILSTAPDGTTSKVAQKIPLARPDGSWMGNVSGTVVQTDVQFASKHFPLQGEYKFQFVNATQQDTIDEVLDIGLRIREKSQ